VILLVLSLLFLVPFAVLHPTDLILRDAEPAQRLVYIIGDVRPAERAVSATTGKPIFGMHTMLEIAGTDVDGPLRLQIAEHPSVGYALVARDLGVINTGKPIGFWGLDNARRYVAQTGQTSLTNAGIIDHQTGNGVLTKAWQEDVWHRRGAVPPPTSLMN